MSLVRWEPMRELAHLRDEMDRLFGQSFRDLPLVNGNGWPPAVDVREVDGKLQIKADLPGVKRENVEITATDEAITIEGHTLEESEEKKEGYFHRERRSGHFMRTVPLPVAVDTDKVEATFEDGTLTITLPKVAEAPKGKKISVT